MREREREREISRRAKTPKMCQKSLKNCTEGSQEAKKIFRRIPGGEKEPPGGEREPQEAKKSPRRAPRGSKWLPKELPRGPNPPKMASKMAPKTLLGPFWQPSSFFPRFFPLFAPSRVQNESQKRRKKLEKRRKNARVFLRSVFPDFPWQKSSKIDTNFDRKIDEYLKRRFLENRCFT